MRGDYRRRSAEGGEGGTTLEVGGGGRKLVEGRRGNGMGNMERGRDREWVSGWGRVATRRNRSQLE